MTLLIIFHFTRIKKQKITLLSEKKAPESWDTFRGFR